LNSAGKGERPSVGIGKKKYLTEASSDNKSKVGNKQDGKKKESGKGEKFPLPKRKNEERRGGKGREDRPCEETGASEGNTGKTTKRGVSEKCKRKKEGKK